MDVLHILTGNFWTGGPIKMILYFPESAADFPQLENTKNEREREKTRKKEWKKIHGWTRDRTPAPMRHRRALYQSAIEVSYRLVWQLSSKYVETKYEWKILDKHDDQKLY